MDDEIRIEDRRHGERDRREGNFQCLCASEPWRSNYHNVTEGIRDIKSDHKELRSQVQNKLSIKIFSLFVTFFVVVLGSGFAVLYDTNKQTLDIVTKTNNRVIKLEAQTEKHRPVQSTTYGIGDRSE